MLSLVLWRIRVTLNDNRQLVGQMLAFDRHMNLVLADCEEFRRVKSKKKAGEEDVGPTQELKRSLGLVILRGEMIVSLAVEGPPPQIDEDKKTAGVSTSISLHLHRSFASTTQRLSLTN
jgi:small nuclear ribonucleoprotein B and B'